MRPLHALLLVTVTACGSEVQLGPGTYEEEVIADAPSLHLRFGDRSPALAKDAAGTYDGTYPSAGVTLAEPGAIVGSSDTAIALSGGSVVAMPAGLEFAENLPFSIEVWVKPTRYDDQTGWGVVVDHQTYEPRRGYVLRVSGFDVAFERWANDSTFGSNATENRALSLDSWHHVVATFDGANLRLFVDGVQTAFNGVPNPIPRTAGSWTVGGPNCECTTNFFAGGIDELAIYEHALDPARVRAHFEASGR
jgi:concanavalin A-like lectin/glucanase superfamily protein